MTTLEVPTLHTGKASKEELPLDEHIMERVFLERHRDLYRYALALTRDHDEAEDIAAETFSRILKLWNAGRIGPDEMVPWLFAIGRNLAVDRWRKARRVVRQAAHLQRPDVRLEQAEYLAWLDQITASLTDKQRNVLVLRYVHSLPDHEIGFVLGLSDSGVRSAASRAIAALRDHKEQLR